MSPGIPGRACGQRMILLQECHHDGKHCQAGTLKEAFLLLPLSTG
jgi:hypothetical protein